jgi:hypothetical protein
MRSALLSRKYFLLFLRKMRMMGSLKTKARLKLREFDREAANAARCRPFAEPML